MLRRRKWLALGWFAVGLIFGIGLTAIRPGLRSWAQFLDNNATDPFYWSRENISLSAFIARIYWHFARVQIHSSLVLHGIIAAAQIGALAVAFLATPDDDPCLYGFGLWIAAVLVASPLVWLHYLPLLVIPIVQLLGASTRTRMSYAVSVSMTLGLALLFIFGNFRTESLPQHGFPGLLSDYGTVALTLIFFTLIAFCRSVGQECKATSISTPTEIKQLT
jgi:hypothetical protein